MAKKSKTKKIKSLLQRVCHPDAAGIDLGATEFHAAIGKERAAAAGEKHSVRIFSTFNSGIAEAIAWLQQHEVKTVAMESTGNYWVALYDQLIAAKFEVFLVNASHCKALPGRKTDVCDAQWIQQLHTSGLLRKSFLPEDDFRVIRYLIRHRDGLIREAAREIQRMQKVLTQMNVQLHHAVSDIDGLSGRTIIEAILAGERDPGTLADLRHPGCKTPRKKVMEALAGNFREEYLFVLGQDYRRWQRVRDEILEAERELSKRLAACPGMQPPPKENTPAESTSEKGTKRKGRVYKLNAKGSGKNNLEIDFQAEAARIYGVDLATIPGVSDGVLAVLLAEIGGRDEFLKNFTSVSRFTSWLGQCPDNRITGGRVKQAKTRSVNSPLARALRMAAMTLWRNQSYLGDFCRKMKARLGKPEGITATAHKLARIIYAMIATGKPYDESIGDKASEKAIQRQIANLSRKAKKFGMTLTMSTNNAAVA